MDKFGEFGGIDFPIELAIGMLQAESKRLELDLKRAKQAEIDEKDKRIEELQAKVDAVEYVLGCAMIAPKEVFQYADRIARALRGNDA